MSPPMNCVDTPNITFSQASEGGATPLTLPDGRVIDPCGLAAALVSLSARQVKALGLRTSGIYGPPGSTSLRSVALQRSLESRLQARLSILGSTLYTLTWKEWVTPSGVSRSRLRASVRRISATETTGWVTPTTRDWKDTPGMVAQRDGKDRNDQLPRQAYLAGWPTPTVGNAMGSQSCAGMSASGKMPDGRKVSVALPHVASMAGWPTPDASGFAAVDMARLEARRAECKVRTGNGNGFGLTIGQAAQLLLTHDQPARYTASGEILTGSDAGMESGGQLNPHHSAWLMGYPWQWGACAPTTKRK